MKARRALCALKGLVKLQALVRGHNVRKQAKMTLQCMQALVRVQARVLDQRVRQSTEGSRKSAYSDTNSLWESRYLQDISDRKSMVAKDYFFLFLLYYVLVYSKVQKIYHVEWHLCIYYSLETEVALQVIGMNDLTRLRR